MKKLTQIMDVFTLGIGRVIASGYAMSKCIPFLKIAYVAPLRWITENGIQFKYVTAINFELRDRWFDNSISIMDALTNELDENQDLVITQAKRYETMEDVIREEIEENTDDEIASDDEIDQWFIERASEFEFHPFSTKCAMCFKREAFYIGITTFGTPFEFCRQCCDELQALKIERTQKPIAEPADWCDGCDGGCWMCGEC